MQAGKNISASEIYDEKSVLHPYRCVGGNGLRGFTNTFNAEGHFAIIGRQGALCGCLNIESGKFYATEHAVVVNGFGIISSLFIYYFFTALNLNQYATATAQPGLAVSNIAEVFIPLPPLPEQLRIVSKIEKLLPLVKTYKQAQNELNTLNATLNEQLRKSILQEAIQGKLVPQIAEEGTAEKLLAEIRKEKESLVKEGKLKKSALSDSIIYKGADNKYFEKIGKTVKEATDEIPFEIPTTWQWVRIKDIFQINPKNIAEDNCISAFIPMEKICATYGSEFSYDEVQWKAIKAGYTHFADGDVAFAKITPCFQNRKSAIFCNLPNGIGAGTTELKVLRQFGETINRWYLLFFLESPYFIDEAIFKGTANQQRIISGYLENKLFPLPPLQEQTRIEKQIKAIASIMRG
ncbi:restriction endonuclease subunit S [Phocaeicola vulgatus]|uniref:restriction endonuclease subunit S n=1 Tax=Phocaeicola vulgatus TaxID=821 RepID=UPI001EEDAFFC|nr:restriction endonuclease subunit S [Phocaeicola vulgatus]